MFRNKYLQLSTSIIGNEKIDISYFIDNRMMEIERLISFYVRNLFSPDLETESAIDFYFNSTKLCSVHVFDFIISMCCCTRV